MLAEKVLSREQLAFFQEKGYLVVENVLSDDLIAKTIRAGQALGAVDQQEMLLQPHRRDEFFLQLLRNSMIRGIMEEVIGPPIVGLATHFFYCPNGSTGIMRHQDNYCVEAPLGQFASCWVPLVDVDEHNGCLFAYPKSHRSGMVPVRQMDDTEVRDVCPNMLEEAVLPETADPGIPVVAKRGAAIIIDSALVHESLPNRSGENRYAFLATYLRKNAPFRPGASARRQEIPLG